MLDADPAACGYADQCRPRGRSADQVWRRLEVEYTLAGLDLLLHRLGWSVQVPARRAAERDEDQIARWREETWPIEKDGGGLGRLALLPGRVRPKPEAAEGRTWSRHGRTQVRVTGGRNKQVSLAALIATRPGHRLIYRTRADCEHGKDH